MLRGLLFLLIAVAVAAVLITLVRRRKRGGEAPATTVTEKPPAALAAPAASTEGALSRGEVFRKLYELAFGVPLAPEPPADHAAVAAATVTALETAATEPRYAPRRPMLLPQILRAVSDNDTSRRELANMIARDPALVGSLLKLANSPFYRVNAQPVESVDRAVAVMGTDGIRSLIAAALVQPVFRTGTSESTRFPEIVWEHTYRSAAAGEVHAAIVEDSDPFAAQLLALVTGLAAIVVYRVALDVYATKSKLNPDPTVIAKLLNDNTGTVARRIAASWELSERILEALDDQLPGRNAAPQTSLGRSLRFGLVVGALTVLDANQIIDEKTGLASLAAAGGSGPRFERMWGRFTGRPPKDEKPVRR
jgi:HD-like signal output (HDOD) protein